MYSPGGWVLYILSIGHSGILSATRGGRMQTETVSLRGSQGLISGAAQVLIYAHGRAFVSTFLPGLFCTQIIFNRA